MDPSYKKPGNRSVIGSGLDESAFPNLNKPLGDMTPPGTVTHPKGSASVSGLQGASTPAVGTGQAVGNFKMK